MLSRVLWLQTPPPYLGGLWCYHVFHSSKPHLPAREGYNAATCPMALDPASLLMRLRCCHVPRGSRPCLPPRKASGTIMYPTAFKCPQTFGIKNDLPGFPRRARMFPRHACMFPRCMTPEPSWPVRNQVVNFLV
jgi:hypothetical protein